MIAKIENGVVVQWPLAEHFIQTNCPETSFAFPLTDETLAKFSFARFVYSDPPAHDPEFQEAKELVPALAGVVATQVWKIVDKYSAEEKAAYIAKRDADQLERKRQIIRDQRDTLLASTDWTQLPDVPQAIKDKYAPYRQALRDVPQQAGFPDNIQWPVKPE